MPVRLFISYLFAIKLAYNVTQRWKPVGSNGTGRVAGRVEILRPACQAG